MRIALYGGVFSGEMASYSLSAPEVVLKQFLERAGHDVIAASGDADPFELEADIHHVHHFSSAAYALALAGGGPFVFTSHNPFLVSELGDDESRLERALQARVLRRADAVVALSAREASLLARRFALPESRFEVIPNGLDLDLYDAPAERAGDVVRILSVGQLAPYKGHVHLLEAVARLVPRHPSLRVEIISHVQDPENEVIRRAAELGLADRLDMHGPLGTPELVERYKACDLYVQPSLAECFPVTVLEAMACGRTVVATDVGGVAEEIGETGVVVAPGDVSALVEAIEPLLADAPRRAALGRAARERVVTLYDGRRVADAHVRLYDRLLGERKRPSAVRRGAASAALGAYRRRALFARYVPTRLRRRGVTGSGALRRAGSV